MVRKRTYASGKESWMYLFSGPEATRQNRDQYFKYGFASKKEATDAEAARRLEVNATFEAKKIALANPKPADLPRTLNDMLLTFCDKHADKKLSPTTAERYRRFIPYIDAALLGAKIEEVSPLHLSREWDRLLEKGGHKRKTKKNPDGGEKPLAAKTVRNLAGFVSAAYARGIFWGLCEKNPVEHSEPPIPKKRIGKAMTPQQQDIMIAMASGPWCMSTFLETCAGLGARRGEVLALRWSDIEHGEATISRSLSQAGKALAFKGTKSGEPRVVSIPESTAEALEVHRQKQNEHKEFHGAGYRADLDLIFCEKNGDPLKPNSVSSAVSLLCRRLKLPKGVSLHTVRHSHGSQLLAAGVPLIDVSKRLGHSSIKVTAEIYSHSLTGNDEKAAQKWDLYRKGNAEDSKGIKQ